MKGLIQRLGRPLVGLVAALAVIVLASASFASGGEGHEANPFWRGYLLGYWFWLGISLGGLGILMLHHLVGGQWGFLIQRILEAMAKNVLLMAVLFLPILLMGMHDLFEWTHEAFVNNDAILSHKKSYLNVGAFTVRAVIYFVVWLGLMVLLTSTSKKQDENGDGKLSNRLVHISGPGLVLFGFTVTFAAFDWAMSLDPHWFSTIYGLFFVVGGALSAFAFAILMLRTLGGAGELAKVMTADRIHDVGKLMFAFTMLWGYINLSQFLIMWYGNLPEEIVWYKIRSEGGWQMMTIVLFIGQFWVPFFLLLSRHTKRNIKVLSTIALFVLVMRFVDYYWHLIPSHPPYEAVSHFSVHWSYFGAPALIGAAWLAGFFFWIKRRPILPVNDPRMKEAFGHGSH